MIFSQNWCIMFRLCVVGALYRDKSFVFISEMDFILCVRLDFFDESTTTLWLESYSTLLYYLGFTLFPFVLFIVYFDLSLQLTVIIGLILAFFTKILMFYKWFKLFVAIYMAVSF